MYYSKLTIQNWIPPVYQMHTYVYMYLRNYLPDVITIIIFFLVVITKYN